MIQWDFCIKNSKIILYKRICSCFFFFKFSIQYELLSWKVEIGAKISFYILPSTVSDIENKFITKIKIRKNYMFIYCESKTTCFCRISPLSIVSLNLTLFWASNAIILFMDSLWCGWSKKKNCYIIDILCEHSTVL